MQFKKRFGLSWLRRMAAKHQFRSNSLDYDTLNLSKSVSLHCEYMGHSIDKVFIRRKSIWNNDDNDDINIVIWILLFSVLRNPGEGITQ